MFSFFFGFSFFALLYAAVALRDPPSRSPVTSRAAVLDPAQFKRDIGEDVEEGEEHGEDEDEEDH